MVSGDQLDAACFQHGKPDFLHHQVTGEAVGGLDYDHADAVRQQPFHHRPEAGAFFDWIGAGNGLVVIFLDDFDACRLRVGRDGLALALVAVLVGAGVGRRGSSEVSNRCYLLVCHDQCRNI